jgi:nicotinamide riboside kinase
VYAGTEDRRHFFGLCKAELDSRGVRYALIRGTGDIRFSAALAAIAAHC